MQLIIIFLYRHAIFFAVYCTVKFSLIKIPIILLLICGED